MRRTLHLRRGQAPILYDKPLPADSTPQIAGPFPNLESDLRGERNPSVTAGNAADGEGSPEWPGNQRTVSRSGTTSSWFCVQGDKAAMPWLPSITHLFLALILAMAISTLPPCTQRLLQYASAVPDMGGGAAMPWLPSIFKVCHFASQQWRFQPHPPCPERSSI